jgi:PEP-CTERM motif
VILNNPISYSGPFQIYNLPNPYITSSLYAGIHQSPIQFTTFGINGLDDQGRILVAGSDPLGRDTRIYLLTPDGVTSNPTPIPEPSTLAIFGVAASLGGFWRWRRSSAKKSCRVGSAHHPYLLNG